MRRHTPLATIASFALLLGGCTLNWDPLLPGGGGDVVGTDTQSSCGGIGQNCCHSTGGPGTCAVGDCQGNTCVCPTGTTACGLACVNLQTDAMHCGNCATACSTTNAAAACSAGTCSVACVPGFGDCDNDTSTGCEVDLNTSESHCGTCSMRCNGSAHCNSGVCQ